MEPHISHLHGATPRFWTVRFPPLHHASLVSKESSPVNEKETCELRNENLEHVLEDDLNVFLKSLNVI